GEDLSINDKDILRAVAYKIKSHTTEANFNMLQFAFPSANVPSLKKAKSRVAFLSGLEPRHRDCCVNSCCCFVGPNEDLEVCPHCSAPRYQSNGQPQKQFSYVPVIPRLVSMFQNPALASKMKYRAHDHIHTPGSISDVFDGSWYRELLTKNVAYFCRSRSTYSGTQS
ncbi:hypothetical protein DEU56DRAFT_733454, partial [Suillus clintonianus]|uniref:uncharacterized protein n=1 Tax=Suillus clintonianus TaxID=1904413 RepID=UPI001B861A3C